MAYQILIVEDEPLIAHDIELTVNAAGYKAVGIANSAVKALDMIHNRKPDIVLLDIAIKGGQNGIDIGKILLNQYDLPFIYITSFADKGTLEAAKSTLPYGFIVKPYKDKDIVSAIEMAMFRYANRQKGSFPAIEAINDDFSTDLTPREYDVFYRIWQGKSNGEISEELFLSVNTVKTHIKNLFSKIGVNSRAEAIAFIRNHLN